MSRHSAIVAWTVDRILGWLPGPPDERRPWSPMLPDPDESGITPAEREQRLRIIISLEEKQGRGTPR